MSVDFIKAKVNSSSIVKAADQQSQLLQFTKSDIEDDITYADLMSFANRFYATNDKFSNYLKSVFKTDNFLSVMRFVRKPLASSGLVNNEIRDALARVLYAEDSYSTYKVNGDVYDKLFDIHADVYRKEFFNNWLFRPNDIYVTDLKETNKAYSYLLDIDRVVSLEHDNKRILRIAYTGSIKIKGEHKAGYVYIDDNIYEFYDKEYNLLESIPHDLGICPASFVGTSCFDNDFIVKEHIFSHIRQELETYNILVALLKLTDLKGAFPTVVRLGETTSNDDIEEEVNYDEIGSQVPEEVNPFKHTKNNGLDAATEIVLDTGTLMGSGSAGEGINMDIVKNYINHFYIPVEILEYMKNRVSELRKYIINVCIGEKVSTEEQEGSKSSEHIAYNVSGTENKLRYISQELSLLMTRVDYAELALSHGKDNVEIKVFCGSKFFKDTEQQLLERHKEAPNPIERKDILVRLSNKQYAFNPQKKKRNELLYELLPYASDIDFDKAVDNQKIDDDTFTYQTRFNYWISMFESEFGDLVSYWDSLGNISKAEKTKIINNLILNYIINENKRIDSTPTD